MWCLSAICKNFSMRSRKPFESCCHRRLWRKTRMVFIPIDSAQPSSRSVVAGSNVSACHISSSLIAVLGMKLLPTSHDCEEYHWFAFSAGQRAELLVCAQEI